MIYMPLPFLKSKPRVPPIERARELNSKGLSETEIIDILKREGYNPAEIDIALSQLLKESIEKTVQPVEKEKNTEAQNINMTETTEQQVNPIVSTQQNYHYSFEDYLNYIDYLIQNRVNELSTQIKNLENKYLELEKRIQNIMTEFKEEKSKSLEVNKEIYEGISRIENKIKELSSKIEGLEEILKEILPVLIDSVRSLVNLTKK